MALVIMCILLLKTYERYITTTSNNDSIPKVGKVHICTKDFPKERYNTYAKSCNSNLYTKYPSTTYSGLLLGTMRCL